MRLDKCHCEGAGFCKIYQRKMDAAGINWCKHTSKEKRENYFVNNGGKLNKKNQDSLIRSFRESKQIKNPNDFQFIIKSFMRHGCLIDLIRSIRRWYPKAEILIVDDGTEISDEHWETISKFPGVKFWHTEYDIGLPAGRNLLARLADKEYVVNCDDDFIFTKETRILDLINVLKEDKEIDIACGEIRIDDYHAKEWCGDLKTWKDQSGKNDYKVVQTKSSWKKVQDISYRKVDISWNFYAARTEVLRNNPNDESIKIYKEHIDAFLNWKEKKLNIVQVPSCLCGHNRVISNEYKDKRYRKEFLDLFLSKWNFVDNREHFATHIHYIKPERSFEKYLIENKVIPNIILLTVGHTGSSVVSSMLGKLGWNLCDADEEYSESVSIRNANVNNLQSRELIKSLEEPWVIKDPRFCEKLDLWKPHLEEDTVLLWITKDYNRVAESYIKRNEEIKLLNSRIELAEEHYRCWTGPKLKIDYDQIKEAVKLFKID